MHAAKDTARIVSALRASTALTCCALLACTELEARSDRFDQMTGSNGAAGAAGAAPPGHSAGPSSAAGAGNTAGASNTAGGGSSSGGGSVPGGGVLGSAPEVGAGRAAAGRCPPAEQAPKRQIGIGAGATFRLAAETLWECDAAYVLSGRVVVGEGTALRIDAGTRIFAEPGALLLVERGGRLEARGRPDAPIVFTSSKAAGERAPGDWRGVVLIGSAPTHASNRYVFDTTSDHTAYYGGGPNGDPQSRCGELTYVRVEFAGGSLDEEGTPGAALTLAGCGSETRVDHVQVHRATDGIGLLGGNVALRHVLVTANARGDCIEWTDGYTGSMQFVVAQSLGAGAGLAGSNSQDEPNGLPRSAPVIYNATLVGTPPLVAGAHFGLMLKYGSLAVFKNSIVTGFTDAAFLLRGAGSSGSGSAGAGIDISHTLLYANGAPAPDDPAALERGPSMRVDDPGLTSASSRAEPSFRPTDSTVMIEPAAVPQGFDTTAAFRGAVASSGRDWTLDWTSYPEH